LFNEIHHLGEVSVPSVVRPPLEFDLGESSPSYLRVTVKVGGKLEKDLNVRFKNPFGGQIDVGGLTTPDGSVELGPVLPGMWLLDIFPIGPSWNYCWPDFVIVPPAASVKLDISIDLVKGVIQFVDRKTSAPLTGHWVMVKSQAGMGHTAGSTDAEGKIELNLPAGTKFYFSVTKPGESQPGGREYKKEVEWTATGPNPSVVKIRPSGS
jgi:hypothetical protein